MRKNYILELALVETAIFLALWLWQPYIGFLLTLIFVGISLAVLLVSLVAELIERTKVPRAYFWWLLVSIVVPLSIAGVFVLTGGGTLEDWL